MPGNQDYADLGELLAHPERWSTSDADRARMLRNLQAEAAAGYDPRDKVRVVAMWQVVRQLDEALTAFDAAR